MRGWQEFVDSLSLSGAIIAILSSLTMFGLVMEWQGKPNAEKVWMNFGSSLTAFIGGRKLSERVSSNRDANDKPIDG